MSLRLLLAQIAASTVIVATGYGEEASGNAELPEPGAWVSYYIIVQQTSVPDEGTGVLTLKFLESVDEQGAPCRWIEIEYEPSEGNEASHRSVSKLLVSEAGLREETNPIRNAVRGWSQNAMEEPQTLEAMFGGRGLELEDVFTGPLLVFLAPSRSKSNKLERRDAVEFQRGRLEDAVVHEGQHVAGYDSSVSEYHYDFTIDYTISLHDDLPCGFAGAKMKWTWSSVNADGVVEETQERLTQEFVLQDFGEGATSALPDHR